MPKKFPELFIGGIALKKEIVSKFLGVFIDENVKKKTILIHGIYGKTILIQFPPRFLKA